MENINIVYSSNIFSEVHGDEVVITHLLNNRVTSEVTYSLEEFSVDDAEEDFLALCGL